MSEHPEPDDLGAHVIRVIAQTQRMPLETIHIDSSFEELKIDSLDGINIVFALENEFGVNIPDERVQNLKSVEETVFPQVRREPCCGNRHGTGLRTW